MGDRGDPQGPWQDYGGDAGWDQRAPAPARVPVPVPPAPVPAERWSPGWSEDHPVGYSDEWGYEENPGDEAGDGALRRATGDLAWRYRSAPLWLRASVDVTAVALILTVVVAAALTLRGNGPSDEVGAFVAPTSTTVRPAATPTTTDRPRGNPIPGPSPHYDNCFQAWRAGALPLLRGDPGYGAHLDDDNDGTACEWDEGF